MPHRSASRPSPGQAAGADPMEELLPLFKAVADASRLKLIGLLATRPHTVEELGEALSLSASTVSHHLARLSGVGLVSARAEGYYNVYSLDSAPFEKAVREVLSHTRRETVKAATDGPLFERKVLRDFLTSEGKIRALPAQMKKRLVLLRHVLQPFEKGKRYSEKQVNELLKSYSDTEYVTLRRYLVDHRMLAREGGGREYWLAE